MKIQLRQLALINFKGAKSVTVDFSETTIISGDNKTGKSTIFDAFTWLLFGKDRFDKKEFSVKTWDKDGKNIDKIDHSVKGTIVIDGRETILERTLREKWVKQRGSVESEFTGNETLYSIDGVPIPQKEYVEFINNLIPEAKFKLLSSPTYYNSLKWEQRREMLLALVGTPSDEEVAGTDLASVIDLMISEKLSVEKLKIKYASTRKLLQEKLSTIPARIDETMRNTPEAIDFALVEKEISGFQKSIEYIDKQIKDASSGLEEQIIKRSEILVKKQNLETEISKLESNARNEFLSMSREKDHQIELKKAQLKNIFDSISSVEYKISEAKAEILRLEERNATLREDWVKRQAEELVWNEYNCPACGQTLPDDLVEHKLTEANTRFNDLKTLDTSNINKQGLANKNRISDLQASILERETELKTLRENADKCQAEILELEKTPVNSLSVEGILASKPEYTSAKSVLEAIVVPEVTHPDNSELEAQKKELSGKIAELNQKLGLKKTIEDMTGRKNQLLQEEKDLASQISELQGVEYSLDQFSKKKIQEVERRVNSLFPTVRFRMFNTLVNGGEEPDCVTLIEGVPYSDANDAAKIQSGLEIIDVFSKANDLFTPIFIDNAESVTRIPEMNTQVVRLEVVKDLAFTVTNL